MSEAGPGAAYEVFALSEALVERLKLLDYEKDLVAKVDGFKIIPRHYFAQSTNAGEQFFLFTELCAWLMRKAQWRDIPTPSSNDDPNTAVNTILEALRAKDVEVNVTAQKLKAGSGRPCLDVLNALVERALEANQFRFERMIPIESEAEHEEEDRRDEDGDAADAADDQEFDEEDAPVAEDEDDVTHAEIQEARPLDVQEDAFQEPLQKILHTVTESNGLRHEIERVLPQLKVTIRASDKHWRMHDEQLTRLQDQLNAHFDAVRPFLTQLSADVGQSVERIGSREKYLNEQLHGLLQEFRVARNALAEVTEKYREASGGLDARQDTLQQLIDEIDQVKQQTEKQNTQNKSGAPLVKVQRAIAQLEKKILEMTVQIAVVEQSLYSGQLKARSLNL